MGRLGCLSSPPVPSPCCTISQACFHGSGPKRVKVCKTSWGLGSELADHHFYHTWRSKRVTGPDPIWRAMKWTLPLNGRSCRVTLQRARTRKMWRMGALFASNPPRFQVKIFPPSKQLLWYHLDMIVLISRLCQSIKKVMFIVKSQKVLPRYLGHIWSTTTLGQNFSH